MSKSSDADFDLELHFLPAWAQKPPQQNRYENYAGETQPERDRDRRARPPGRRPPGPRPPGPRPGPAPAQYGAGKPPAGRTFQPQRPPRGEERGDRGRRGKEKKGPPPAPLPELNVAFVPDDKGVDSLARQIKMTGRAYPLFEIAQMVLQKPERYSVTITTKKNPDGAVAQSLFVCALDETVWLSEQEAVRWALDKHFETFYQPEKTQIEPPKGTYTFVAQCGLSGVILGPPNYHDYQNRLRKLHADRFANLPFEVYKTRVRIVKDEAIVKKWIDDQSWKTEYICLNLPEPLKLSTREEVEQHFRQVHLPNIVKQAETARLNGLASRQIRSSGLARLVRQSWEDQRHFPLQVATVLSQQFAARGLQFFKVNKTVTHVAVARPHYLDMEVTPVSEGVKRIVEHINTHPKTTRREVVEALAPTPPPPALPALLLVPEPEPAGPVAPTPEGAAEPAPGVESAPAEATPATPPPIAEVAEPEPTPEQTMVIADLHWLIHQGHVIEFANGLLETAKKPLPKPPKPAPPPAAPAAQAGIAPGAPVDEAGTAAAPVEAPAPVEPAPCEGQPALEAAPPAPDLAAGNPEIPTTAAPSAEEKATL